MKNFSIKENKGFTLVEVMVAISIFVVVVLAGTNALINVNKALKSTRRMSQIVDTINFAAEDMSRNIRLGAYYNCANSLPASGQKNPVADCAQTQKTIFLEPFNGKVPTDTESNFSDQLSYKIEQNNNGDYQLFKSINGGVNYVDIISNDIILDGNSGFKVYGSGLSPDNQEQPRVTFMLSGYIKDQNSNIPFSIQTTISQRILDN